MKIFAIMLVKNEADIVGSVLKDAQKWADNTLLYPALPSCNKDSAKLQEMTLSTHCRVSYIAH